MSKMAQALVSGSRRTDGIYEIGVGTLRSWAARIIAGTYDDEAVVAHPPRGL